MKRRWFPPRGAAAAGLAIVLGCTGWEGPPAGSSPAARAGAVSPPSSLPETKEGDPSREQAVRLFNRAQELIRRGESRAAEALLGEALAAHPGLYPAHQALGEIYEKDGRKREAAAAYRQVLRLKPDHVKSHVALGRLAEEAAQPEAALYHYERAVALDPGAFLPHFRLGLIRRGRQQLDAAVHHLRAAARIEPAHQIARYWLWLSVAERGGADDWEVELGRSLVEGGDETPVRFYQARAAHRFREGKVEEALKAIQKAVDVNPHWREARWRSVLADMERYRRARK